MFSITGNGWNRTCQGYSRREFLRVGSLGLGGISLPELLAARAKAAQTNHYVNDVSVVFLFLSGGPSHIEFFDPKMTAPPEICSITGEVQTRLPGITFGGTFPKLAQMTDKLSIVRSYGSQNGGHTYNGVASGNNPLKAAMGAIYSRVTGANHPTTGIPTNILVKPEAIQGDLKLGKNFETGALPTLTDAGTLGKTYAAFDSSGSGTLKQNMELRIPQDRLNDRRSLLNELDRIRFNAEKGGFIDSVDKYRQQAFEMISRGIADAFDLTKEDPATIAKYDTTGIFHGPDIQRYYDMRRASNLLGHQMLMARRLVESGCGFVTVSDCGWDMHANNNSPKGMAGMWPMGHQVDHAVAAFIQDVYERGLSEKILLVVTGEMGRTPRINRGGGRDHFGGLTPLLFSGGGLKMGQVVGQSDRQVSRPVGTGYDPRHLLGTIMHTLFDVGQLRLDPSVPRDVSNIITNSEPIGPLVG